MKFLKTVLALVLLLFISNELTYAQRIYIGPRVAANYNIFNVKNSTRTYNGVGISGGAQLDALFSRNIGVMVNLNVFDMKNVSSSLTTTAGNTTSTTEDSYVLSYTTIDPMFQTNFSGFFLAAGPSIGFKLNASGERETSGTNQAARTDPLVVNAKSTFFGISVGTGYNIRLSPGMVLGTDFFTIIPISDTFDAPGTSNKVL